VTPFDVDSTPVNKQDNFNRVVFPNVETPLKDKVNKQDNFNRVVFGAVIISLIIYAVYNICIYNKQTSFIDYNYWSGFHGEVYDPVKGNWKFQKLHHIEPSGHVENHLSTDRQCKKLHYIEDSSYVRNIVHCDYDIYNERYRWIKFIPVSKFLDNCTICHNRAYENESVRIYEQARIDRKLRKRIPRVFGSPPSGVIEFKLKGAQASASYNAVN
jgi:hypothetical protein